MKITDIKPYPVWVGHRNQHIGYRYPQPEGWGLCFLATAVFSKSPPA